MQKYSYSPLLRIGIIFNQVVGVFGILLSTAIAVLLFIGTRSVTVSQTINLLENPRVTLICIGIWTIIVGWVVSIGLINSFPTIWIGKEGITISAFLFFRVLIPWSEIIDINIGRVRFGHYLVRAKRISIFHRVYGWLYSRTFYPSFLIGKCIRDRDELISEIKQRIQRP